MYNIFVHVLLCCIGYYYCIIVLLNLRIMLYDAIVFCVLYVVVFLQQGRMAMPIIGRLNYQSINQSIYI